MKKHNELIKLSNSELIKEIHKLDEQYTMLRYKYLDAKQDLFRSNNMIDENNKSFDKLLTYNRELKAELLFLEMGCKFLEKRCKHDKKLLVVYPN